MHTTEIESAQKTPRSARGGPVVKVWDRLKEISRIFQRRDKVHQTAQRLVRLFEKQRIPYAITGAMAVNLHGARRTTDDVDFLLSQEGFDRFVA